MATAASVVELLRDPKPVTSGRLRELIVNHVLAEDDEPTYTDDVVGLLLSAHYHACVAEADSEDPDDPREIETCVAADAEQAMHEAYDRGFNDVFPEYDVSESFCWPDCIPYGGVYECGIVRRIGYALGCRQGRQTKALCKHFAEEHGKEAEAC